MNDNGRPSALRRAGRRLLVLLVIILIAAMVLVGFLTLTEFDPEPEESVLVRGESSHTLRVGDEVKIVSWNIGYGALGDNADFFMDGGKGVQTADEKRVNFNMQGMLEDLGPRIPDIIFLQEVDVSSSRSHKIDETAMIAEAMPNYSSTFAGNFKVAFVPYPIPPIGKVSSGLLTLSGYPIKSCSRIQLPCPFKWPVRVANFKRCLSVNRISITGSDKELVAINLHLEAYDDGEGKIAQTEALAKYLRAEVEKGNYVIAGGDFNQVFSSVDISAYPTYPGKWECGTIDEAEFDPSWQFVMDSSTPTCRSLDQPYEGADKSSFQFYMIDGFIVSDNLTVLSCDTQDLDFKYSDHNPVVLRVKLK